VGNQSPLTDYYKTQKRSNRNVIVNVLFAMTSTIGETRKISSCVLANGKIYSIFSMFKINMNLNSIE